MMGRTFDLPGAVLDAFDRAGAHHVPFEDGPDRGPWIGTEHIQALVLVRDFDEIRDRVGDLVTEFCAKIAEAGLPPPAYRAIRDISSHQHVDCWAFAVEGYPARCLMSFSAKDQSWLITLDVYRNPAGDAA